MAQLRKEPLKGRNLDMQVWTSERHAVLATGVRKSVIYTGA